jgi:hypothetical protein
MVKTSTKDNTFLNLAMYQLTNILPDDGHTVARNM